MPTIPSRVQQSQYGPVNNASRRRKVPAPILLQNGSAQGLEHTGDRKTQRLQQSIKQSTQAIRALPWAAGNLMENVSLVDGNNYISHGLPQAWRGVMLVTPSAFVNYKVEQLSPSSLNEVMVNIIVNTACTCDLWIW